MKGFKSAMLLAAASAALVSSVYAGGPTVEPMHQEQRPDLFASLEGGYTWNQFGDTTLTNPVVGTLTAGQTNSGGSGRVAIGGIHYTSNPNLSYTAEVGGGYYGSTEYTSANGGINATNYIYGLDLLAGVDYEFYNMFDVFAKAGGMIQNLRLDRNTDLSSYTGGTATGTETEKTTVSYFAPEVALGGAWDFTSVWGLSLAYYHVFGNNVSMSKTIVSSTNRSSTQTDGPVSLNTLLVGLRYKFA